MDKFIDKEYISVLSNKDWINLFCKRKTR